MTIYTRIILHITITYTITYSKFVIYSYGCDYFTQLQPPKKRLNSRFAGYEKIYQNLSKSRQYASIYVYIYYLSIWYIIFCFIIILFNLIWETHYCEFDYNGCFHGRSDMHKTDVLKSNGIRCILNIRNCDTSWRTIRIHFRSEYPVKSDNRIPCNYLPCPCTRTPRHCTRSGIR